MDLIYDKQFLKQLDEQQTRETYAKLTLLSLADKPLQQIEGKVSTGSINVDGTSAVRRTCQLSLITPLDGIDIDDTYWCFNSKFKLEIGLRNYVNNNYPDIIWFEMGVYLIVTFNINKSTNNITISISGKDKMCRLNGEISGNMPAQWDWGSIDDYNYDTDITTNTKIPLKTIIYNAVHQFAQEPIQNIIINDLDTYGYELWEYLGDEPMYYFKEISTGNYKYMTFDSNINVYYITALGTVGECKLSQLERYYSANTLDPIYNFDATKVVLADILSEPPESNYIKKYGYYVIRVRQDETAGYHQIPLVYNADLLVNAGESVTVGILDKIVKMLGNYEYFYNIKGQFIFQKKKDYIQELWATSNGALTTPMIYNDIYSYRFENEKLFTAISSSPNIGNVKNDYVVWGTRPENKQPIHARCAIDKKPISYVSPWERYYRVSDLLNEGIKDSVVGYYYKDGKEYKQQEAYTKYETTSVTIGETTIERDLERSVAIDLSVLTTFDSTKTTIITWRIDNLFTHDDYQDIIEENEIVYGWVVGTGTYSHTTQTVTIDVKVTIPEKLVENKSITNTLPQTEFTIFELITKFEEYGKNLYVLVSGNRKYSTDNYDWRELIYQMAIDFRKHGTKPDYYLQLEQYNPQYLNGKTGYEQYYIDLEGFWRQLYNPSPISDTQYTYYPATADKAFWNVNIHNDPNTLLFWFEFFDTQGELSKYSVQNIGVRPKIVNETSVTSIYHKNAPEIQLIVSDSDEKKEYTTSYTPMQITKDDMTLFYRSSQGNSAIARINELMYNHLCLLENENITAIPIYYLQPNTRIYIKNKGDYTISKLSYNLSYNGTMSITASKIYRNFY